MSEARESATPPSGPGSSRDDPLDVEAWEVADDERDQKRFLDELGLNCFGRGC